jgi:hypothetical protein
MASFLVGRVVAAFGTAASIRRRIRDGDLDSAERNSIALSADHIELELTRAIDAPNVTHLHYRVIR